MPSRHLLSPQVFPVIHYQSNNPDLAIQNAFRIKMHRCAGVFLISMTGDDDGALAAAIRIKATFPGLKVGVNLLGKSAYEALIASLLAKLDATWSDHYVVTSQDITTEAIDIATLLQSHPSHHFFTAVDFKYQAADPDPTEAARKAVNLGFIPTTSGPKTGEPPTVEKIQVISEGIQGRHLAVASGLTPDNIRHYRNYLTHALVATGISGESDGTFSDKLLKQFMMNIAA